MESQKSHPVGIRAENWVVLALCVAVVIAWAIEHLIRSWLVYASGFTSGLLPLVRAARS